MCKFCADETIKIDYKDAALLKYFITDRGKLVPRRMTGNCAKHQREIAVAVNRARMIALMPFAVTGSRERMQVILREDMDNLGKSGEVVNVKPGYGRNYLLPRGQPSWRPRRDVARVEHEKRVIAARTAKLAKEAQAEADKLSQVSVSIARAVGEEDKLYGSVTTRDIAEALQAQGVTIDPKKIELDEPIKALGHDRGGGEARPGRARAKIKVWVVKKDD